MYYSLGCAVVVYLGLSTLEVGPLGNTSLKGVVDAQKVSAMFVGVAMVLSLCEVLVQVGEKHIGKFERYVIENAEKATVWGQVARPIWRAIPRVERLLTLFALTVFAVSFVHFVSPLLGATWLDEAATSRGGVRTVVVATMVVLAFPFILLVRVERAWLGGVVAMGLVGVLVAGPWKPWLVTGLSQADTVLTAYPVMRVDTSVVETRLSANDREILTDVVLFEFDSAVVRAEYGELLRAKVAVLGRNESVGLRLEGHTDDRGSDEVNYSLGRARALAVRDFLSDHGIDVGRLAYVSRGRSQPKDTARNDAARELNRRVEFFITDDTDRYLVIDTVTVVIVEADTTLGLEATTLADTVVILRTGGNRVGRSR
ncbi:MAG: OmpA family protein [Chloroflexota bacterium]|nr:OmpA family protein [Chloroflexota bacterium]